VVIGFIWTLIASFTTILFPVWESRDGIMLVMAGICGEISGNPPKKYDNVELKEGPLKDTSEKTAHDPSEHVVVIRETSIV